MDLDICVLSGYTVYIQYTQYRGGMLRIIISNASDKPIYEQIADQIKTHIINGELMEGEMLPSIRNLAKELQISVITTKRAYEELEREGYIVSVPGKGSFVSAQTKELLKEARVRIVEDKLEEAVAAAKTIDLPLDELINMLRILYEEE